MKTQRESSDQKTTSYTIAVTGHRPDKLGGYDQCNFTREVLKVRLRQRLGEIRYAMPDLSGISGMALGFDQWSAEVFIELEIPFTAAVPFEGQEQRWPEPAQEKYRMLLSKASRVVVAIPAVGGPCREVKLPLRAVNATAGYVKAAMRLRNEWMMQNCDYYIAAWDGSPGGTANCIEYANQIGRQGENLIKEHK